jgi:hypothetical protein
MEIAEKDFGRTNKGNPQGLKPGGRASTYGTAEAQFIATLDVGAEAPTPYRHSFSAAYQGAGKMQEPYTRR